MKNQLTKKTKALMGLKAVDSLDSSGFLEEASRMGAAWQKAWEEINEALNKNDFMQEMGETATAAGVSELYDDYKTWVNMLVEAHNFFNTNVVSVGNTVLQELRKKEGK